MYATFTTGLNVKFKVVSDVSISIETMLDLNVHSSVKVMTVGNVNKELFSNNFKMSV